MGQTRIVPSRQSSIATPGGYCKWRRDAGPSLRGATRFCPTAPQVDCRQTDSPSEKGKGRKPGPDHALACGYAGGALSTLRLSVMADIPARTVRLPEQSERMFQVAGTLLSNGVPLALLRGFRTESLAHRKNPH